MKTLSNHKDSENRQNQHKNDLGYGIPKDYFSNAKKELEESILTPKKGKIVFLNRSSVRWVAASAITILVALTVFKPNALPDIQSIPAIVADSIETFKNKSFNNDSNIYFEEDISIASLFVNDSEIDEYVENFILQDIIKEEKLK